VFESVFLSNRITVMAAHPGRVFDELGGCPLPRDDAFRTSPHYAELCRNSIRTLSRAMGMESRR
jgi:NitT/TauT family transport system ATP-binding protein